MLKSSVQAVVACNATALRVFTLVLFNVRVFIVKQGSTLTLDDYAEVSAALWDARHKWFPIGVRFAVKITDLEAIRNENDVEERFHRMVTTWLKAGKNCNWKHICEALGHPTVGMQHMAEKLRDSQEDKSHKTDGL